MYDLDSTIDVLKNLLILRDTESMVKSRFAPVIEYIKDLIPENDQNAHEEEVKAAVKICVEDIQNNVLLYLYTLYINNNNYYL